VPLFVSACSEAAAKPSAPVAAPIVPMSIAVTPAIHSTDVAPDADISVRADGGTLHDVQVIDSDGHYVEGSFDPEQTSWTADANLQLGEQYFVYAAGEGAGGPVRTTTTFTTRDVDSTNRVYAAAVSPADGERVGVAHPLIVYLNRPAKNRQAVQDALEVVTSPRVEGAWYWIDGATLDYRPQEFWPAGTKVTFRSKLAGVSLGDDMWGSGGLTSSFQVGRDQVIKVDVAKHRMTVVRDGRTIRSFPVSTGKPGWETRNGVKVLTERVRNKKWTNEAIDAPEDDTRFSDYAVRMTNSGEFIHDATWNSRIGEGNTSHGCIGMRLADMAWVWANTMPGDPVVVSGSPRKYTNLDNRIADWNIDWETWRAGNAAPPAVAG
jgi:lipoprotein-anchoring transpeptidase ErfK/SrfK